MQQMTKASDIFPCPDLATSQVSLSEEKSRARLELCSRYPLSCRFLQTLEWGGSQEPAELPLSCRK